MNVSSYNTMEGILALWIYTHFALKFCKLLNLLRFSTDSQGLFHSPPNLTPLHTESWVADHVMLWYGKWIHLSTRTFHWSTDTPTCYCGSGLPCRLGESNHSYELFPGQKASHFKLLLWVRITMLNMMKVPTNKSFNITAWLGWLQLTGPTPLRINHPIS